MKKKKNENITMARYFNYLTHIIANEAKAFSQPQIERVYSYHCKRFRKNCKKDGPLYSTRIYLIHFAGVYLYESLN